MLLEFLVLYPFIWAVLLVIGLWAEVCDNYITNTFFTILAGAAAFATFGVSTSSLITLAWIYVPVGLLWSVWRWRVHCSRRAEQALVDRGNNSNRADDIRAKLERDVDLAGNVNKVIPWVLAWPTSMVAHFAGDLIRLVKIAITQWFGNIYRKFSNDALAKFDK
mgnify:CR=1 FL=1